MQRRRGSRPRSAARPRPRPRSAERGHRSVPRSLASIQPLHSSRQHVLPVCAGSPRRQLGRRCARHHDGVLRTRRHSGCGRLGGEQHEPRCVLRTPFQRFAHHRRSRQVRRQSRRWNGGQGQFVDFTFSGPNGVEGLCRHVRDDCCGVREHVGDQVHRGIREGLVVGSLRETGAEPALVPRFWRHHPPQRSPQRHAARSTVVRLAAQ